MNKPDFPTTGRPGFYYALLEGGDIVKFNILGFDVSIDIKKHVKQEPITINKIIHPGEPNYGANYEEWYIDADGYSYSRLLFRLEPRKGQTVCWWS